MILNAKPKINRDSAKIILSPQPKTKASSAYSLTLEDLALIGTKV